MSNPRMLEASECLIPLADIANAVAESHHLGAGESEVITITVDENKGVYLDDDDCLHISNYCEDPATINRDGFPGDTKMLPPEYRLKEIDRLERIDQNFNK